MKRALLIAAVVPFLALSSVRAAEDALPPKDVGFSFEGPFGTYDRAALQRGFQVYKEVCAACHGLSHVAFHALGQPGGPEFSEAQVAALASQVQVPADPNEQGLTHNEAGERLTRPGIPADRFPSPFPNEQAARFANAGSLPPDLSLITKARAGGPEYVYSILTGYGQKPPADFHLVEGKYYNPYFPGGNIAMAPPLVEDAVSYADGTKASVEQQAHDVTTFLMWAAEPKMEQRKRLGFGVMAFLIALSALLYLSYRRVWRDAH